MALLLTQDQCRAIGHSFARWPVVFWHWIHISSLRTRRAPHLHSQWHHIVQCLSVLLPCAHCRAHLAMYRDARPPRSDPTDHDPFVWFVRLHNAVRVRNGQAAYSLRWCARHWSAAASVPHALVDYTWQVVWTVCTLPQLPMAVCITFFTNMVCIVRDVLQRCPADQGHLLSSLESVVCALDQHSRRAETTAPVPGETVFRLAYGACAADPVPFRHWSSSYRQLSLTADEQRSLALIFEPQAPGEPPSWRPGSWEDVVGRPSTRRHLLWEDMTGSGLSDLPTVSSDSGTEAFVPLSGSVAATLDRLLATRRQRLLTEYVTAGTRRIWWRCTIVLGLGTLFAILLLGVLRRSSAKDAQRRRIMCSTTTTEEERRLGSVVDTDVSSSDDAHSGKRNVLYT